MGRFYKTAQPQFVEDFVYTPPYEMLMKLAETKQQALDTTLAQAKLFDNFNIQHLKSEDDIYNVKELQRYYGDAANNIAEAIRKDKGNVQAYMPQLEALQKELEKDFTTGNISKIQSSAAALAQWEKDNEAIKKDFPGRYQAAKNYYLEEWLKSGGNSLSKQWSGEQVTKDLNYEDMRKSIAELKASKVKGSRQTPGGGLYMVETEKGIEEMSLERLNGWLLSQAITPENLASLKQSQQFKLGTYTDANGNLDWDRGTLFAPLRGMAAAATYKNIDESLKYSGDTAAIAEMTEAGQNARHAKSLAWEQTKFNIEREDKIIEASNKDRQDKINAYEMKIAEAQISGDDNAIALWENKYNNLLGKNGLFSSEAGSIYSNVKSLQEASARSDTKAQKIIDQNLPQILGKMGINYNNPKEKALAQEVVGLFKKNQLDENNLKEFLNKKLPKQYAQNKYTNETSVSTNFNVKIGEVNSKIEKLKREAQNIKDNSIDPTGNIRKNYVQDLNKIYSNIKTLEAQKNILSTQKNKAVKEASKIYKVIPGTKDLNENFRDNMYSTLKDGLSSFTDSWKEDISKFKTTYETAPLGITSQSTIKSLLRDDAISKDLLIETGGKNDYLPDSKIKIVNITAVTGLDGFGRNGLIGLDANGKQYKLTASPTSPIYQAIMNIAKADVNPNSTVGMQLKYPTTGRIKQIMEGAKTLKSKNIKQNINVNGATYTIVADSSDKVQVIDSKGNKVFDTPKTYIEAGQYLDTKQ